MSDHHHHDHHDHRGGIREIFAPHSHDASDSVDDALESSAIGIRAVKISLLALGVTATFPASIILVISGSIALAADTIHNVSDALTAIPLWIAFVLGRKAATKRMHLRLRARRGPGRPVRHPDDRAFGRDRGIKGQSDGWFIRSPSTTSAG